MRITSFPTLALALLMLFACNQGKDAENKMEKNDGLEIARKELLISTVETYIKGIKERDFSIIPYAEKVTMRTPFTKNGTKIQLKGKEALFNEWWKPLLLTPNAKEVVFKVTDYYFNESLTSIVVESVVTDYNAEPPAIVYVAERFTLNEAGEIIDQINHIDVRDVLTPGWSEK
jgi:hypothetical protein